MSGQIGQDVTAGTSNFNSHMLFAFLLVSLESYFCHVILTGSTGRSVVRATWSTQPKNEDVAQVCMQVVLPVPACCNSTAYHTDIRESFLKSYKNEKKIQMCLQGLGTGTWHLEGRVMFAKPCKLRYARERIKGILLKCHERRAP
jgi:hypothetical protein